MKIDTLFSILVVSKVGEGKQVAIRVHNVALLVVVQVVRLRYYRSFQARLFAVLRVLRFRNVAP